MSKKSAFNLTALTDSSPNSESSYCGRPQTVLYHLFGFWLNAVTKCVASAGNRWAHEFSDRTKLWSASNWIHPNMFAEWFIKSLSLYVCACVRLIIAHSV